MLAVGGCTVGPDYKAPEVKLPERWAASTTQPAATAPATQPAVAEWWKTFDDPLLERLVVQALDSNRDLKIATSRVREARALRQIAVSGLLPNVNGAASYQRSKGSENNAFSSLGAFGGSSVTGGAPGSGTSFISQEHDLWQAGFDASWEIDVFGGLRRGLEAADADIGATLENRRDVMVSLAAEVAANYMDLRGFQRQIEIAKANIRSQRQTVELTRVRATAGLAGDLDTVRAEAQVATTSAGLPLLEVAARRTMYRIGVLVGSWPEALVEELAKVKPMPAVAEAVPAGLPSDLLRRRADIRRAERQLAAATARVGVATADLYPKFSLTGGLGLQSDKFKTLFNSSSNYWSIGPGVKLPIFDRNKIKASIEIQDARTEQSLLAYENTVIRALEEVENALVQYAQDQERRKSLAEAVRANRRAVELASELYTRGLVDFLSVLDAQRNLFLAEEQLAGSERSLGTDLVALYKALGGGWEESEGSGERGQGPGK